MKLFTFAGDGKLAPALENELRLPPGSQPGDMGRVYEKKNHKISKFCEIFCFSNLAKKGFEISQFHEMFVRNNACEMLNFGPIS